MRTLNEAIVIVKSLFSAPLGSFPRGGIESSMRVRLSTSPTTLTLMSEHDLSVSLSQKSGKWVVKYLDLERSFDELEDAIFALVEPIIRMEISSRLG
jgi:hypothetical protein